MWALDFADANHSREAVWVRCLAAATHCQCVAVAVVQLQPAAAAASTLRVVHAMLTRTRVEHPGLLDDFV